MSKSIRNAARSQGTSEQNIVSRRVILNRKLPGMGTLAAMDWNSRIGKKIEKKTTKSAFRLPPPAVVARNLQRGSEERIDLLASMSEGDRLDAMLAESWSKPNRISKDAPDKRITHAKLDHVSLGPQGLDIQVSHLVEQ